MSKVFFDTNLFIYLAEDSGRRSEQVFAVLGRMADRKDQLITSAMSLAEVLVKPLAQKDYAWVDSYERMLISPGVMLLPFDRSCARIYAQLRNDKSIKAPDAMQLSCAAAAGCDLFITNDDRLSRKIVPGIQFITSLERAWI